MQKLKTCLKQLNEDDIVSIGAKHGAGYIYIGRAGDIDKISKEFENQRDKTQKLLDAKREEEMDLVMNKHIPNEFAVHDYAKAVSACYTTIEKCRRYLKEYIDPFKRFVMEFEERDAEEGYRIVVSGNEVGNFWFKDEYDKQKG